MRTGSFMQIAVFIGFLVAGAAGVMIFGGKDKISESENRALAPYPVCSLRSMMSGGYFRQLENFVADHIAFRDALVQISKYISTWHGVAGRDSIVIVPSKANNTSESQQVPQGSHVAEAVPVPERVVNGPAPAGRDAEPLQDEKFRVQGKVAVVGDRAVNLFKYDAAAGQAYADAINDIGKALDRAMPNQVRTSVLLAPTAAHFVRSAKLKSLSDSQKEAIDKVYGRIESKVKKVDVLSMLEQHADESLYFRTDHHWTANGAYYAYAAYVQSLGLQPAPLASYSKGQAAGFLGSLYASTMNRRLAEHPDDVVYYMPSVKHQYVVHYSGPLQMPLIDLSHAQRKNKYRIFLSGDRPWAQITTDVNNGRRLAVVKDSYGNAFVPFLLPHYSEIFVVDPRQFGQSIAAFMQKRGIHELLFVNNAEVTMDLGFAEQLQKLIKE
ncbi:hypothetical protein SD70_01305 [Gordoniibacillus kamchatkensis]|uniref:DHHW protein n=1 Tax=Gordoniibacillus kamchatkensis TaxID=1590651 RepID=A0ABR5AMN2_9BACL|nr:DHHW family protein [Paenibacillus sp. VKM B-2647]KIL42217.1 hypothetical protein SD70_01305 [Paenibacillus sp. VKM B-2647]